MNTIQHIGISLVVMGLLMSLFSTPAYAEYDSSSRSWVKPVPGCGIPDPYLVPGKEYSDHADKDMKSNLDPLQAIQWDGHGGVRDAIDYGPEGQVDALASWKDSLFIEVINADGVNPSYPQPASLLFSVGRLPSSGNSSGNIYYEKPACCPKSGIWATSSQINENGVMDVDGLEIWGTEESNDALLFSMYGDPNGIAVFSINGTLVTPYISTEFIAQVINNTFGRNVVTPAQVDLDALMVYDLLGDGEFNTINDRIMFSVAPISSILDGGEIFVFDRACSYYDDGNFLHHGGHLWDTNFNVMETFGVDVENVNALEAVPEPATVTLLSLCLAGFIARRKRI